jgi:hypothetical protein
VVSVSPVASGQDLTPAPQLLHSGRATARTPLTGDRERPTPVATEARGSGRVTVDERARTLTIDLSTRGLSGDITGAHIHLVPQGGDGVNGVGPVVFDLLALNGLSGPILDSAARFRFPTTVVTGLSFEQIRAFQEGRAYFNVHTSQFPDGEIRGNLAALGGGQERAADFGLGERAVAEVVRALAHRRGARSDVVDALFATEAAAGEPAPPRGDRTDGAARR